MLFATLRAGFPADLTQPAIEPIGSPALSYADLLARSGAMAHALGQRGLSAGDRLVVQVDKSVEALLLYLACLRAGLVYVPVNPGATARERDYFVADAEPALVVDAQLLAELTSAPPPGGEFADVARKADDLAAILYTSGTTGRSKGAMLSNGNLAANARTLIAAWRFTSADRLIHALPIFHVHGLFVATHCVLGAGARMLWLPGFDADAILAELPRSTVLMGVPTFYTRLLARPELTPDLAGAMRLFVSGSAPLPAETHRAFEAATGHQILERYGMTETGMLASNPYDGARVAGSVGPALPGVSIRIAAPDAHGVGGIEVKGPNVFSGYWRMPEKTAEEFTPDGWFRTGDLGRFDAAGYLSIVGRAKDLIISGGFNVYPAEVEAAIEGLPGVGEVAVIGVPHPDFGEGVVAVLAPKPGATIDREAVAAALRETLGAYKRPKAIEVVDALPRNAMGKIEKAALRRELAGLFG